MLIQPSTFSRVSKAVLLSAILCGSAAATIENISFSDTRGISLGGATVASVDDAAAGLVNPAALGFMASKGESDVDNNGLGEHAFGWNMVDIGLGATLTGDLGDYLEILGGIDFDNFETQLDQPESVKNLLSMAGALGNVSDRDTIVLNASAGTAMQIGHFGIGVRAFGQMGGWINDLDLVRLGLGIAVSDIVDDLRDAMASDTFNPGSALSDSQKDQLRDAFKSAPLEDVIDYIDAKVTELIENGTIGSGQIQAAIDTLSSIIENSGGVGDLLSNNRTSITGRAFAAVEVPVSYGYAVNDNFSLGVTAKALFGRVYGTQVWVFNDDNTDILEDSLDTSNDSVTFGLDLAAMYRIPKFQFALVGHNLNSPRFDGYDQEILLNGVLETIRVPDVVLDPQVTVGAAWIPVKRFMLESDLELLETGTILNNYNVQRLSFGTELDLSLVALRLGTYKNLAEADIGWVLTGGVGFNLWALSVDIGAAISIDDTVVYDGTEYPRTARLHAGIGLTF
ncbi:MAG: conjugal transfer protein TraF [Verrucomicrobia bacterium]|nr:conjugal transfer protein TraF [Verrucomicrobiota bacterium]